MCEIVAKWIAFKLKQNGWNRENCKIAKKRECQSN